MTSIACPPDESNVVATRSPSAQSPTTDHGQLTTDPLRAARNRANAAKSTGPRTPRGKARSSQNATTHGLTALTPPPDLATDPDFQQAKAELVEEYRPTTPTQVCLVNQLAHLTWKLDQIPKLEHQILATPLPSGVVSSADHDLTSPPASADPTLHLTALHLLQDRPTPLTRLWDLHRRLLARTQSIVRQLIQLRAHHQKRQAEDAALAADLDQSYRADCANAAERAYQGRQRHLEEERRALAVAAQTPPQPATTCQSAPTCSNAPHPTTPAQNEPTSSPPSVSSVSSVAEHSSPPAQNEPTMDNGPLTMDTHSQSTTNQGQRTTDKPTPHNTPTPTPIPSTPTPIHPMTP